MNAIILAAGKSSRMQLDGYAIPKPLLPILGTPNIERTVLFLNESGIFDITILIGQEHLALFSFLNERYGCTLISSAIYLNTLFSMNQVIDKIDESLIIEGDVVLAGNIFQKRDNSFYYTMRYLDCEPDAWCPVLDKDRIVGFKIGASIEPCLFGISFWAHQDCALLRQKLKTYFTKENFQNPHLFWDDCVADLLTDIPVGTYEISPDEACEMNMGLEYQFAQDICARYYRNCERFLLNHSNKRESWPTSSLSFVKDMDACQVWQVRLLEYTDIHSKMSQGVTDTPSSIVFHEREYPFMVRDNQTGKYVAYLDVSESSDYVLLRRLLVDEACRKQGIGTMIVKRVKLYAKLSQKELRVNVYDQGAESFYTSLGMKLYFKTLRI